MIMNSRDKRWLALAVVCMGQLMMILDATIVAVALPAIKTDLHFSSSSLTWVMNAYLIAFGSFLLLGGRLGDLIGRTRMFLVGIAIFTGASVLCGVASSEAMLIGARFVQGFGAAAAASAILALIVVEFPDARERVRVLPNSLDGLRGAHASRGSTLSIQGVMTCAESSLTSVAGSSSRC